MAGHQKPTIKNFVLDVDGVLTDGTFYYTTEGKVMKKFGPDDADALLLLSSYLDIHFVSGDKKGFEISRKRIETDMKYPLHQVSTFARAEWLIENGFNLAETIYMGDGIFDAMVFNKVAYGIAPANSFYFTKEKANYVTPSFGGNSAVAEACLHILETFFEPIDLLNISGHIKGGEWGK
jgi:3-deoxy-D-manno-octulosonate 8-phosphate phosphatase (KDO 8-P phosphatase)